MMDAETKRLVRLNVRLRLAHLPPDMRKNLRRRVVRDVITHYKAEALK